MSKAGNDNNGNTETESPASIAKVVSLVAFRQSRQIQDDSEMAYRALVTSMDKIELLDEMVRFQENRTRVGHLTKEMMIRGRILFRALEKNAETHELRLLTRSYARHLEYELQELAKKNR